MRQTTLLMIFAIAALAQSPAPKPTQQPLDEIQHWRIMANAKQPQTGSQVLPDGILTLDSGISVAYRTAFEPGMDKSALRPLGSGIGNHGNTIQSFVYDSSSQTYFGYDMTVTAVEGSAGDVTVTLGPLTVASLQLKAVAGNLPLNPAPQPKFPSPQTIHQNQTIAFDLMQSADGRERMVNYFHFLVPSDPRDFTADDAPLGFTLDPPTNSAKAVMAVRINGAEASQPVATVPSHGGGTMWFYVPGYGRYILSLAPHDGFVKAGMLRDNRISFQADGQQYEIRVSEQQSRRLPVEFREKTWNLYLMLDGRYQPSNGLSGSIVGGIDRLENLVRSGR